MGGSVFVPHQIFLSPFFILAKEVFIPFLIPYCFPSHSAKAMVIAVILFMVVVSESNDGGCGGESRVVAKVIV